jgi:hypothetical protein
MKHLAALLLLTVSLALSQGQDSPRHYLGVTRTLTEATALPEEIARQHLHSVAQELSLTASDLDSVYVAEQYRSERSGVIPSTLGRGRCAERRVGG